MKLPFPSREFDEAVAAVCHGTATDDQMRGLNGLLRDDTVARDEYIFRLELHSRLASEPDLFASVSHDSTPRSVENILPLPERSNADRAGWRWALTLAACLTLLAVGWWGSRLFHPTDRKGATSNAVAMLGRVVDAQWDQGQGAPRLGSPLEPGWLRLTSGMAQIVFYSGARLVMEGPAELLLISQGEARCQGGRLLAEVPPQAKGFRITTPEMSVTDLGTSFGLDAKVQQTELHVFKGSVEFHTTDATTEQNLKQGAGAVAGRSGPARLISANPAAFASLFDVQPKSSAAEVLRHQQWQSASHQLDSDPSLLVHFGFEPTDLADWRLPNTSRVAKTAPDGTIVGCQWVEGRWSDKRALEFRNVNDRVRLNVTGAFESLTLASWVRVQGLDRQFNSLFMSDGFESGTVHWLIREDGVLGLTAIGAKPGDYQICASAPVLGLDQLGIWLHLAVVVDGNARRVVQYVNGVPVSDKPLKMAPPFRIGAAELGNWNASGFPGNDPSLIRNFSGAMDEFCLFSRALNPDEVRALYSVGKPQPDAGSGPSQNPPNLPSAFNTEPR